ncbi:MAG: glycosyltransferase family 39 protein [Saprospiraceae bacterium]
MEDTRKNILSSVFYKYRYHFFLGMIVLIAAINLTIDIMEIDAAQYASISLEMSGSGSYLQVMQRGQDYLDKPPLLFWLSSVSISLFGNSNIGYKLPAVLMLIIALWATFSFAKLWYDRRTGIIAVLILGTTQGYHLMTNDVRTDGLLTAFVILSVWLLSLYLKHGKWSHLILGGFCTGAAMLAKGPIGMVIPAMAILGHLILNKEWKKLFNPAWLLLLIPVVIVLAPMCYGLYTQFDLHPEKEVYGMKGPSGLMFYFWTQSFGRITGDSQWHNNAPVYYFFQTMLWDFQPWIILFFPALVRKMISWWKQNKWNEQKPEWISLSGFVLPFIALSMSGYKLPHYIFPLFPFAAVITADHLVRTAERLPRWFEYFQMFIVHLLFAASLLILLWVFPDHSIWILFLFPVFYFLFWWTRIKSVDAADRWLMPSLAGVIFFQLVMSLHFYPQLLKYQSSSEAGKYIAAEKPAHAYWYDQSGFALDYYSGHTIPNITREKMDTLMTGCWIYVTAAALSQMPANKIIRIFDDYRVTVLSMEFLNPATRNTKVKKIYLIELKGGNR